MIPNPHFCLASNVFPNFGLVSRMKKKLVDWAMLKGEKGEWLIQFLNFNPFVGFLSINRLFENVIFDLPYFCPHF